MFEIQLGDFSTNVSKDSGLIILKDIAFPLFTDYSLFLNFCHRFDLPILTENMLRNFTISRSIRLFTKDATDSWEFIRPYPKDKKNPEYGFPSIPIPPPIQRPSETLEAKRKRLIWASRKRGILETDLLLGTFIQKYVNVLSSDQLTEYDTLLDENDWDIYYWATGARDVPERISTKSMWNTLYEHCKNKDRKILKMPELLEN